MARRCPICGGKVRMVEWEESEDARYIDQFDDEEFHIARERSPGLYNPVFRCEGCEYEFASELEESTKV